jgi:DNA invertase Pin-like site-specific DNA recombinase
VLPRHARVFAEFETNLRRERQLEGIAKAEAAGIYKGRQASIDAAQVRQMKAQGLRGPRPLDTGFFSQR